MKYNNTSLFIVILVLILAVFLNNLGLASAAICFCALTISDAWADKS